MKFEDDDLKDGKLWAALQKEIDRDLAEKESGETFQEELDRKSTRLNSSHKHRSRMPSSA